MRIAQVSPLMEAVPPMARPDAEYIDEIAEREKSEFLGNAAALLFPIDWQEPFGLAMIEAMACSTPMVAWRNGSVSEIVDEGVSGFVVDDEESAAVAARRAQLLDRARIRKVFECRFTARRMAEDYVRIYRSLCRRDALLTAV